MAPKKLRAVPHGFGPLALVPSKKIRFEKMTVKNVMQMSGPWRTVACVWKDVGTSMKFQWRILRLFGPCMPRHVIHVSDFLGGQNFE